MNPVRPDLIVRQTVTADIGAAANSPRAGATAGTTTAAHSNRDAAKLEQAGRDFESVFLRQMLSALERTTKVGQQGANIAGQQAYGSMIVEAVADAVATAGGLGVGSVLVKALAQKSSAQDAGASPTSSLGSDPQRAQDRAGNHFQIPPAARVIEDSHEPAKKLPQGSCDPAVPGTEIRTSPAQMTGQLVDRRIR